MATPQMQQKQDMKKDLNAKKENGETNNFGGGNMRGNPRGRGFRGGGRGGMENMGMHNKMMNDDHQMNMNDRGGRGGQRGRGGRGRGKWVPPDRLGEKLKLVGGPQIDLPPREEGTRKFSNHCRLWIGNLPLDIGDPEIKELFKPFGEFDEVYFDKTKGFAFVRLDYKANAERAKQELHMKEYRGRQLKIRFSNPGTALKIRNLTPWITNELLERAFNVFGDIERAIVVTDDRGKVTGEGIVEFCKKPCALAALKKCTEGCFFLTTSPRPVIVESLPVVDDNDGMCEININKRNPEYLKERQTGPRFAAPGSFEFEYGLKWKQLYEMFDKRKEVLERELNDEKKKLEEEIEFAKYQHETEQLREQLRHRDEINSRQKDEFEQRQRDWDEHRRMEDDRSRRIESELSMKYRQQDEELRRRQEENRIFMQERQHDLMKADTDGFMGDFAEGGGNWRRTDGFPVQGSSWRGGAGGGRGANAGSASWAEGTWEGHQDGWQNDSMAYGRNDGEVAPPPDPPVFMENFNNHGNKFEQSRLGGREAGRNRWARGDREEYGPAKRGRF